ncbi:VWA domain-containing protein [Candidatus Uhrbacteria bacterium]|nr:VWA domain-containing protein [Candidatus Uhrbacteria bacterium]
MRRWLFFTLLAVPLLGLALRFTPISHAEERPVPVVSTPDLPAGSLRIITDHPDQPPRTLPLRHTSVEADVAGNVSAVTVRQEFVNPATDPIEAVYVFPLPEDAAVHAMEMHIDDRVIKGTVRTRDEARRTYETARANGQRTSLLEQERPNIFTQSVANIPPGASITIELRYVHALVPDDGQYTFVYPMVVGPRYIPGARIGQQGTGWSSDTDRVPDASRVTPPVLPPGERSGHDIELTVRLDAGLPIDQLRALAHAVDVERGTDTRATIRIRPSDRVPNKDFVLRWRTPTRAITPTLLAHRVEGDGHFLLLIQPPATPPEDTIIPKELIFIVDTSGSMSGHPLAKVQAAMRYALDHLHPNDTFTILSFQHTTDWFSERPVPATREHIARAQQYINGLAARGGTEMLRATQAALRLPESNDRRVRIVSLMSDGYVGNEREILTQVATDLGNTRLFPFGVGSSVNRHLITALAQVGRGHATVITLQEPEDAAVQHFYDRLAQPMLTNIQIDWGGLAVHATTPDPLPDLFAGQLVAVTGKYTHGGSGTIRVRGMLRGASTEFPLSVTLPESESAHDAIPTIWARSRVEAISNNYRATETEQQDQITALGLTYNIATAYTSFVAVDTTPASAPGQLPRTVPVPVLIPDGVSHDGIFGQMQFGLSAGIAAPQADTKRGRMHGAREESLAPVAALSPDAAAPSSPNTQPVSSRARIIALVIAGITACVLLARMIRSRLRPHP